MANNKVKYKLKGHGTFVIREGWMNKALALVEQDNVVFREKKAADMLGVGTNMAQAIRYWLKASELMTETSTGGAKLTTLGKSILKNDPYMEDIFSIWMMHCNLVMNKELATAWYLFFNKCEVDEYSKEEIEIQMKRELGIYIFGEEFSEKSLKDDVNAICNMYAKVRESDYDPEDNKVSPFASLGLLKCKKNIYSKEQPKLDLLDDKVVLYALIKQMNNEQSIAISELINGENSVCRVLNLSRVVLNQYLDRLESKEYIRVNRTAGLDVVYRNNNLKLNDIVDSYYLNLIS